MPRLPAVSGRKVVAALRRAGFSVKGQKGSHVKLRRGDTVVTVPVHGSKDLKRPTVHGIIKDAGLTVEDFIELL